MRFPFGETIEVDEPESVGPPDPYSGEPTSVVVTTAYDFVFVHRDEVSEDERPDRTSQAERYFVAFGDENPGVTVSRHAIVRFRGIECKADGPSQLLRHPMTGWAPATVLRCVRSEG